jgi:integral membrane protein (TIGR01906 family)
MKRFWGYFFGIIASLLLIAAVLITSVEMVALNISFYKDQYAAYDVARSVGVSNADLEKSVQGLIDYVRGARDDMDIKVEISGKSISVFNKTEKTHMKDVRALWLMCRDVRNIAAAGAALLMLLVYAIMRRDTLKTYCKSFFIGLAVIGVVLLAVGIWVAVDFTSFWTNFHLLFFTNNLWILDYNKDLLIRMMPEQLFFNMVSRILSIFAMIVGLLSAAAAAYLIIRARKRRLLMKTNIGAAQSQVAPANIYKEPQQ